MTIPRRYSSGVREEAEGSTEGASRSGVSNGDREPTGLVNRPCILVGSSGARGRRAGG